MTPSENVADIPVVILCGGEGTRIREASERLRPGTDHAEPVAEIVLPVGRSRVAGQETLEAVGHRLDGRQRIVDLVTDHANEALPGLAFLVAQRSADARRA